MARAFCHYVDVLNEWTGRIARFSLLPLTFIVVMDVILRYAFDRPTAWAWDVNVQLLGVLVILGGGYCLLHGAHVGVDVLVERASPRTKMIVELVTTPLLLFGIGVLLWRTAGGAWVSLQLRELYSSFFLPPIYPFKMLMVVGVLLFLLQGIAKFIRILSAVIFHESGEMS